MDNTELAQEMLVFLEETNQYSKFIYFMENRGFDSDELELDCDRLKEGI